MGHIKIIVDHDKIEYSGPLELNNLFRAIENFIWERGFDKKQEKDFEINNPNGKSIEWQISPWKIVTDYGRYIIKVRLLGFDIVKADTIHEGKKTKVDNGRIIIVIDGFVEYDVESRWETTPFFHFLRNLYDHFIFKAYTERFEQMLVHDVNHLHDHIEKFLNFYRHYKVISHKGP